MNISIEQKAEQLLHAKRERQPLDRLFDQEEQLSVADAFRIQQEVIRRQVRDGDHVVGFKLGNIAKAMQTKFGVDQPDYGHLLASQFEHENLAVSPEKYIEPFVELEPAFVLKAPLGGEHVTVADVISATDYMLPSLEIIDSRIRNWDIGIFDTLADAGSTGGVVLGAQPRRLSDLNLSDTSGEIRIDGEVVARGNTSAIYGNPVSALVWLTRRVSEFGLSFSPGDIILPGSCLAAVAMEPNTSIAGRFAEWGEVAFEYRNKG